MWDEPKDETAAPRPGGPAGWYRDPWSDGYRWWDGAAWTSASFAGVPPQGAPAPPPQWTWPPPAPPAGAPLPPTMHAAAPAPAPAPARNPTRRSAAIIVAAALVAGVVGAGVGAAVARRRSGSHAAAAPTTVPTTPRPPRFTPQPAPVDPSAASLASLVLKSDDVAPTVTVSTIPGGTRVNGEATLDLCDGDFPSEDLRTARLQVAGRDEQGDVVLSTEAVLYRDVTAPEQAFSELKSVAASCPATTERFNPAPDGAWPQTPSVDRLAFDFVSTDATTGEQTHGIAVFLRRGRALLGVYFTQPDAVPTVSGASDVPGIVTVFAKRLAALPASVVGS